MATEPIASFGGLSLVKKDGSHSQRFPLVERRYLFGRADYCDIRINLLKVSREHAEIVVDEKDQVWVNSLSKSSDTVVSQKRVSGKILLQDNDRIEIGERQFIFHKDYNAPESAVKVAGKDVADKGKTPLKDSNSTPGVVKPVAVRTKRYAGFTSTPTKGLSRDEVAAALSAVQSSSLPPTDENAEPTSAAKPSSGTSKSLMPVIKPTPRVAVATSAPTNTPKPASSVTKLTKPTVASAAKMTKPITPRAVVSAAKAAPAASPAATQVAEQGVKATPESNAKSVRNSLGGKTPTVTMTCRYEALDMQLGVCGGDSIEDSDATAMTGHKSVRAESIESQQFGSPAAIAPQPTTTLVFSATKMVPDLTATTGVTKQSPKMRTPPPSSSKKPKGLLKTPNSVNKRRSVCFVDHRNETAYLASNSSDPDFIPGIVRIKTPQPKFPDKVKEETKASMSKLGPSPAKRVEGGKRSEREATSPLGQNPRSSKRRRVEPTTYAGVTISRTVGKDGSSASYVELSDDAPGVEDIEAFFLDAANRMFADLMSGTVQTPDKYYAGGKWAGYPAGNFPKAGSSSKSKRSSSAGSTEEAAVEWAEEVTKTLTGKATPSKADTSIVAAHMAEASGFLFKSPKPNAEQAHVIGACLENAVAALTDSASKLPGSKVAKGARQMFTSSTLPKQPWQELLQSMHASFTPNKGAKASADDAPAQYANELWHLTAPTTDRKMVRPRRTSAGSVQAEEATEERKPRRASTGSITVATPAKAAAAEEEFEADAVFAEVAPKTEKKTTRRSSAGAAKGVAPAKMEIEEALAPRAEKKTTRRSSAGSARMEVEPEFDADAVFAEIAPKTEKKTRRSSSGAAKGAVPAKMEVEAEFDASAVFAEIAPKTAEKRRRSSSAARTPAKAVAEEDFDANAVFVEVAPKTVGKNRRSSSADRRSSVKSANQDDFDSNAVFAEVAPKTEKKTTRRSSAGSARMEVEPEFDADAVFAEIAPKTEKKTTRRSSSGAAKGAVPVKMEVEEEFDASAVFAEIAPKTAEKRRRSSSAPSATRTEEDFDANAAFAAVAPKTAEKSGKARRASGGAKAAGDDFDANVVFAETAPKTAEKPNARRRSGATNTATQEDELENFDASAVFAAIAPATEVKRRSSSADSRRSLPGTAQPLATAKTPAQVAAKQKMKSYRSAVKARTPAKPEVVFDADAVYADVAPKTGGGKASASGQKSAVSAAKGPRRSSLGVLARQIEAEMDVTDDDFDANEVYASVAPKSSQKLAPRASISNVSSPVAMPADDFSCSGSKRKRSSPKDGAKSPVSAPQAEVEFDANAVYAEIAPKTPKRSRWSLSNMVSNVVSSVASMGRRLSGARQPSPARKSMSPAKPAEPEHEPSPAAAPAPAAPVQEAAAAGKPARRGRKSVMPELPKEEVTAPVVVAEEEEPAKPPPRRGRKSIVPAVIEEGVKKVGRKRKSVMPEPVVEVEEEAPRKARKGVAPKSPHVTIGEARMHLITPRQKNDWRAGCETDTEMEDEEEVPAPKKAAKKGSHAKAEAKSAKSEAEEAANGKYENLSRAELVALAKERGIKANGKTVDIIKGLEDLDTQIDGGDSVEEPAAAVPDVPKKASRSKKAAKVEEADKEEEPEPQAEASKKAGRGRKSVAPVVAAAPEEPAAAAPMRAARGRKSVAPAVEEPEPVVAAEEPPKKTAARSRKSVAPAPVVLEPVVAEVSSSRTSRSRKSVAPAAIESEEAPTKEVKRPADRAGKSTGSKAAVVEPEAEPVVEKKTRASRGTKASQKKVEAPARRSSRRA